MQRLLVKAQSYQRLLMYETSIVIIKKFCCQLLNFIDYIILFKGNCYSSHVRKYAEIIFKDQMVLGRHDISLYTRGQGHRSRIIGVWFNVNAHIFLRILFFSLSPSLAPCIQEKCRTPLSVHIIEHRGIVREIKVLYWSTFMFSNLYVVLFVLKICIA